MFGTHNFNKLYNFIVIWRSRVFMLIFIFLFFALVTATYRTLSYQNVPYQTKQLVITLFFLFQTYFGRTSLKHLKCFTIFSIFMFYRNLVILFDIFLFLLLLLFSNTIDDGNISVVLSIYRILVETPS